MKPFPYRKSILVDWNFSKFYIMLFKRVTTWFPELHAYPKTNIYCWLFFEVGVRK